MGRFRSTHPCTRRANQALTARSRRRSSSDAGITVEGAGQKTIGATDGRVPILLSALIGAAAIIGAAFATRALISDSGYCAQFCPNANCQNLGPGNPYTDGD
jgi:hypothetical protein